MIRRKQQQEKLPAAPGNMGEERFSCFLCSHPMAMIITDVKAGVRGGWCDGCQVIEEREPFTSRVQVIPSVMWGDMEIVYVDHAKEHWCSPA